MAVVYAFCCLCCSALNDFIFKLFADRPMSRGSFFSLIGVILSVVMGPLAAWQFSASAFGWACAASLFSIVGNVLLIEAMGHLSVGICSTVYRLNLIFVVPGAMFFFGEKLSPPQLWGVLAAVAAITLFSWSTLKTGKRASLFGMVLIVTASLLRAGMGLAYKQAFNCGVDEFALVCINGLFWVVGGIIYAKFKDGKVKLTDLSTIGFSAASGLFVVGITFFMVKSLQCGAAGWCFPSPR